MSIYRKRNLSNLAGSLLEAYRPNSFDLEHGTQELLRLAREAWQICRLLDQPRRHLASLLTDVLLILVEGKGQLTAAQLACFLAAVPLLRQDELTNELVAKVDQSLLEVGLTAIFPMDEGEAAQYLMLIEEPS